MNNQTNTYIPTLAEFIDQFNRPNYFDDPRTPEEMKQEWRKAKEDAYYKLFGQEKIESLRIRKEKE